MKIDFEWKVSLPDDRGLVTVVERLCGTELLNISHPMPPHIANTYIRARRSFVSRTITTRLQATQIFNTQPRIISP